VLVLATVLLVPFRDAYYRHARLLSGPLQSGTVVPLLALVMCAFTLAAFEPRVRGMSDNSWVDVVLSPALPNSLRATVALTMLLGAFALWRLIRPGRVAWLPWSGEGRLRYAALGALPPAHADGIVMGELGRAGIPFRRMGRVLLGLGDPAGSVTDRVSAIWNLRDLAAQEGLDAAVWRAGPGLLKVYADLGLAALPLVCQYLCCVAERDLSSLLPLLPVLSRPEEALAGE
jgi:lysylphosphatidylglycerol synthetase-like protein (DUF2156 family)